MFAGPEVDGGIASAPLRVASTGEPMILFGTRTVRRPVRGGARVMRPCGRCGTMRELVEHTARRYFTLYFLPVIPLEAGERVLACARCGAVYDYPPAERRAHASPSAAEPDTRPCPHCRQRLRTPSSRSGRVTLRCPRCGEHFVVEG